MSEHWRKAAADKQRATWAAKTPEEREAIRQRQAAGIARQRAGKERLEAARKRMDAAFERATHP